MMARMSELVGQWDPYSAKASVFRTDDNQESAQGSDAYFLESADKASRNGDILIHIFLPGTERSVITSWPDRFISFSSRER